MPYTTLHNSHNEPGQVEDTRERIPTPPSPLRSRSSQSITSGIGPKLTPGQFMAGPVKVISLFYLPHHSPGPVKVYQREVL